jgi:dual specificity MAP kinase phosphatase
MRESLPPLFTVQDVDDAGEVAVGQDMEIKDKEGRYRHMRRAPVDENTLQPMRRVSKAGLESGFTTV